MADAKVSALTADTAPALSDLLYEVKNPGTTPVSRKVTVQKIVDKAPSGAFTPGDAGDWSGPPTAIQAAFDELAARLTALEASPAPTGGAVLSATVTLDDDEIKAQPTTQGFEMVATPGAGKVLCFLGAILAADFTGGDYVGADAIGATFNIYGGLTPSIISAVAAQPALAGFFSSSGGSTKIFYLPPAGGVFPDMEDAGLGFAYHPGAGSDYTGGSPGNSLKITVYYAIADAP